MKYNRAKCHKARRACIFSTATFLWALIQMLRTFWKKKQSLSQTQFNRKLICYKILINYQILPRGRTRSGLRGSRRRGRTRRPPRCLCCEIRKARNQTGFSNILCVFKKHKKETIALMTNSFKMLFSRSQHECF